jgi:hypothetical protein
MRERMILHWVAAAYLVHLRRWLGLRDGPVEREILRYA